MTHYYQGAQQPVRVWNAHSLAVRTAYKIGLPSKAALAGLRQSEIEARKRTWHGCVVLDSWIRERERLSASLYMLLLVMTLDRPLTIPPNLVDMDLPTCHQFPLAAEAIKVGVSTSDSILLFIETMYVLASSICSATLISDLFVSRLGQ